MKHYDYHTIKVESFQDGGKIRVRPLPNQSPFETHMVIECSKVMRSYPIGTRFKIRAKITDREGGNPFIYSHYSWPFEVFDEG
jgi:hypothetical protein